MIFDIVIKGEGVIFVEPKEFYGSRYFAADTAELLWECGWRAAKQNWNLACYDGYENAIAFQH